MSVKSNNKYTVSPLGGAPCWRPLWYRKAGLDEHSIFAHRVQMGGAYRNTMAVNAFRIIMSPGNIAAGTVCCYGIALWRAGKSRLRAWSAGTSISFAMMTPSAMLAAK